MPADNSTRVYFDHAATAPFDTRLIEIMESSSWANANALYEEGREAAAQLRDARTRIARALKARAPQEIIFTSGGSESDNMAIKGLASKVSGAAKTHVIVSAIEHHAVLNAADSLKASDFKVDRIDPDSHGVIQPDVLDQMIAKIEAQGDAVALVAVHAVNNEIGTIQPIRELAGVSHKHRSLFFCDAVQALGKIDIDLEQSGADACAFSAHKIGAPKGMGVLYLRRGVRLSPLIHGGGQESGFRSGTSNVPSACAFARAIEYAVDEREQTWSHVQGLREHLLASIAAGSFAHALTPTLGDDAVCVPHIISLVAHGLEGETLVLRSDNEGFAISAGSACSSASLEPSHVLRSIGLSRDKALGGIRLSLGKENTLAEIDGFVSVLPEVLR